MTNHEVDILMQKIALGNMAALEELYKAMSKSVYFYALHLSGNPDTAEDVMQDTFVSVMRNSSTYNVEDKGTSWIFTIAKNKFLDIKRKEKPVLPIESAEDIASDEVFYDKTDSRLSALKMLESLSKKERDIVMLRLFGDMTLTQVSKELGLPKGTVFWTYNNAIKKLTKAGGEKNEK